MTAVLAIWLPLTHPVKELIQGGDKVLWENDDGRIPGTATAAEDGYLLERLMLAIGHQRRPASHKRVPFARFHS